MRLPSTPFRFLLAIAIFSTSTLTAQARPAQWIDVSRQLSPGGGAADFTPHGTQPGLDFDLQYSEQCSNCHGSGGGGSVAVDRTMRPFSTWAGSMMANATRDPVFWAALDVANNDVPGVGDYCLRCHTPQGWFRGNVVKQGLNPTPNDPVKGAAGCLLYGTYASPDDSNSDFGGTSCHYCHRLMAQGPQGQPPYEDNGNAWVDDLPCDPENGMFEPCRRGPYDYATGGSPPPHAWKYSEFHTQSAICGTCHNVSSPDLGSGPLKTLKLGDGTDTARAFPIERTYNEWLQSQYAQAPERTCQSCHMPSTPSEDAYACIYRDNLRQGNLPVHQLAGGNTWVPGIIKGEYAAQIENNGGHVDRTSAYDQTIDWARQLLTEQSADVATTITSYTPAGAGAGALALRVKVTNKTGHKLPTGYAEGRRMWLNLQVKDANGALVFESAAYDPASGVLTQDKQARVYEALQGIWNHRGNDTCDVDDVDGTPMFHFALNDCVAKDNRIPPLGFKPASASDPNGYELLPVGANYPETTPGSGILINYDQVDYAVALPPGTQGPLTATARLYYQTSSKEYIEFLRDEALENSFQGENQMCGPGDANRPRPFSVGPQNKTRGQYLFDLWNEPVAGERIFADGFDGKAPKTGYGKSPPELMQTASATTN
ncbi:hypothetical protein [Dokdonella sp.]|uniref:hypothetical protein n=1 Tax=Dokdonella sp. TaxID=2291710 RepID=UPI001B24731F|nr:hypothetical protein [Dokdonella sp.]MBO9662916.1 hypothetical protein [Dokdonella sp.]